MNDVDAGCIPARVLLVDTVIMFSQIGFNLPFMTLCNCAMRPAGSLLSICARETNHNACRPTPSSNQNAQEARCHDVGLATYAMLAWSIPVTDSFPAAARWITSTNRDTRADFWHISALQAHYMLLAAGAHLLRSPGEQDTCSRSAEGVSPCHIA